jgi:NOL1/NOP2/fmu family ribosome biogenesis protein
MPFRARPSAPLQALSFLTVAALLVAAAPARADGGLLDSMLQSAKDAPAKLYEGKAKTYGAGVMTPEALTSCLILAHRVDAVAAEIAAAKSGIRDLDGRIQEAGPRLQHQAMAALTDPERRKTYEAQVAEYNAWVEQRRAAVETHNRQVRLYSEMSGRFNGECNGRSYFPSDLAAVKGNLPPEVAERVQ